MSIRADTRLAEERILNYVVLTVASTIEAQSIRKEICATEQEVAKGGDEKAAEGSGRRHRNGVNLKTARMSSMFFHGVR